MRLHRLAITAFGPFAARQEIDLDALAEPGLFLLHGPTGAGKTSVLDAVCFALYGQVPGARQKGGRLRSDHAAPDAAPEVVCEFSLGPRRFEITRSPEWQRPKRRGDGTTKEQARALVRERNAAGEWVALTTRADEAGHLVRELIGMGPDQFTKLVLLPQGEFAAFLRATAEERRSILQRLFATERFAAVEAWLVEHRRSLGREVAVADVRRDELLAKASQAASVLPLPPPDLPSDLLAMLEAGVMEAPDPEPEEGHAVTCLADVQALAARATARMGAARTRHAGTRAALDSARLTLARTRELAERQKLVVQLSARREDLLSRAAEHAARREALDAAARTRALAPLVPELRAAVAARGTAASAVAAAADLAAPFAGLDAATLRSRLDQLADAVREAADLDAVSQAVSSVDRAVTRGLAEVERAGVGLDLARTHLADTQQALATSSQVARDAPAVREALERARTRLAAARERDDAAARLRADEATRQQLVDVHQQATEHWLDLRRRRLEGYAAELAAALEPDAPCPVCGSAEHPSVAEPTAEHVGQDDEQRAHGLVEAAADRRETVETRCRRTRERLTALTAVAGEDSVAELSAAASASTRLVEAAEAAVAEAGRLTRAVTAAEAAFQDATGRLEVLALALARERERRAGLAERRAWLAERQEAARGEFASVAAKERHLRTAAQALEALAIAERAHAEAVATHDRVHTTAAAAARAAGFGDLESAVAAALPPERTELLRGAVAAHEEGLARLAGRLEDQLLIAAAGLPPADVDAEVRAERSAAASEATAGADVALHDEAARNLEVLAGALAHHEDVTAPVRRRFAVADELARCAEGTGGDNTMRMRLSAYVLAARLEQVALAASLRLEAMSSGRYTLVHTDDLARGGARSGLGLRVVDGWTGRSRDPSTLSGGETFYASLALALGLADVVQQEAGGTAIETLLVDEGFGTLDEDTLEDVMAVLDGLRAGGRTVGLVSHVADLRHRIPSQLEVVKTPGGSMLRQHVLV